MNTKLTYHGTFHNGDKDLDFFQNLLTIQIEKVFPKALITFEDNQDDIHCQWSICPTPGTLLTVKMRRDDDDVVKIIIERFVVWTFAAELRTTQIYNGTLPLVDTGKSPEDIDLYFFRKMLENWRSF